MKRYICIHGHFYQPPRENPWLEDIEFQESAYPYHDWNERITAECYEPNTASRILDGEGRIERIVNNYTRISFDFGPTLLSWMEAKAPEVYCAIIQADQESQRRFSGHGSAMALVYSHMIMPLANRRDKHTQVIWGIRDFEYRFGRRPEGMFLPETAVDLETLAVLAEHGIRFTLLAPHQARRVRRLGTDQWQEVQTRGVDPTMPYRLYLPGSDRYIDLFFYDGSVSQAVAFEGLLANGEFLVQRLEGRFDRDRNRPQLVHIATDGETYGHHHRHGDMALAYALHRIEAHSRARITNYGEYLALHPPTHAVEIVENTAWSCAHGVERWRSDCGCNSGRYPGWHQGWRAPLREAFDWLRDTLAPRYEEQAGRFFKEPWAARDGYIAVILDRSPENVAQFLKAEAGRRLEPEEAVTALKLLEMQRHAMLMYTSCGWFFDDISGLETTQVLRYAGRVIQLAEELFAARIETPFLERLAEAKSNIPAHRDGAHVYEKYVKPAMVDLAKVGAHYAITSLFDKYQDRSRIYCYTVHQEDRLDMVSGKTKLAVGRARFTSRITRESETLSYGALYFGGHHLNAGVRVYRGEEAYQEMVRGVTETFDRGDLPEVIRLLDRYFSGMTYSLKQLFRDKQREVVGLILDEALAEVESDCHRFYERHVSLMRLLKQLGFSRPKTLHTAAEFVINIRLRGAFLDEKPDLERIAALLREAETLDVKLHAGELSYALERTVERMARQLADKPGNLGLLQNLEAVIDLTHTLPFEVDLWKVQNIYYKLLNTVYPMLRGDAAHGDEDSRRWVERFEVLGEKLRMRRGT